MSGSPPGATSRGCSRSSMPRLRPVSPCCSTAWNAYCRPRPCRPRPSWTATSPTGPSWSRTTRATWPTSTPPPLRCSVGTSARRSIPWARRTAAPPTAGSTAAPSSCRPSRRSPLAPGRQAGRPRRAVRRSLHGGPAADHRGRVGPRDVARWTADRSRLLRVRGGCHGPDAAPGAGEAEAARLLLTEDRRRERRTRDFHGHRTRNPHALSVTAP